MKEYDDVVSVMQVGTSRAELPSVSVLPLGDGLTRERQGLVLAGALDLMSRAGAVPVSGIEPLHACPQESAAAAHRSAEPLSEALTGGMTAQVLEWAAKAEARGLVAPPAVLAQLLLLAVSRKKALAPVLGVRGLWLGELQGIDLEADSEDLEERRAADPSAYREWLGAELSKLDWKERAQAAAALRHGLSQADEPLLETMLTDRRKEVREPAFELLASMEHSRVARELSLLVQPLIRLNKTLLSRSLAAVPPEPEALPKWLPRTAARDDFGPKALALFDLLRWLPPKAWGTDLPPKQYLDLAAKTDYAAAILDGLQESAIRFQKQEWIDAVFEHRVGDRASVNGSWPGLAHHVSEMLFDRAVSSLIAANPESRLAVGLLNQRKKQLSLAVSKTAIQAYRGSPISLYALRDVAGFLHPGAAYLLEERPGDDVELQKLRDSIRKTLDIRNRLLASLDH